MDILTYKKYAICFDENTGLFSCEELNIAVETYAEIKTAINKATKTEKAAPRVAALYKTGYGAGSPILDCMVGKREVSHYGLNPQYWITYTERGGAKRSKEGADQLYLDTPENRQLFCQVRALIEQAEAIEKQAEELFSTAKNFEQKIEAKHE